VTALINALWTLAQSGKSGPLLTEYRAALERIESFTTPRFERFSGDLQCQKGCDSCCVAGLSLLAVEALSMLEHLEKEDFPKKTNERPSHCPFLGQAGACSVYPARPVVCRTQGLPLVLDAQASENTSELRIVGQVGDRPVALCPLNFQEDAPPADALLDSEVISQLLFTVDQRFRASAGLSPGSDRISLAELFSVVAGQKQVC
jgi:Fe-S-cluster containining protein